MHRLRWLRLLVAYLLDPNKTHDPRDPVTIHVRITPFDVELLRAFSHTFLSLAALGRWQLSFYSLEWRGALRDQWGPFTYSETIRYRRALKLFAKVAIETRPLYWDAKMIYLEHRMISEGEVCAVGLSRGAFFGKKGRVSTFDALRGLPPFEGEIPEAIKQWIASDELLDRRIAPT